MPPLAMVVVAIFISAAPLLLTSALPTNDLMNASSGIATRVKSHYHQPLDQYQYGKSQGNQLQETEAPDRNFPSGNLAFFGESVQFPVSLAGSYEMTNDTKFPVMFAQIVDGGTFARFDDYDIDVTLNSTKLVYSNASQTESPIAPPQQELQISQSLSTFLLVIIFFVLLFVTMIGNVLVCLSLIFVKKLRKPQNYLIASLAVSDLFVALFVMPFAIVLEVYEGQWPFDMELCDFWVSGILMHGPPGCGKTLIAKAMAKESQCWLINVDVSSLTDKWLGESEKMVVALFSLAEKLQPCIIFIDEIDSLLRSRSTQDNEHSSKTKAQFMSLWDGLITDPNKTVIVLGATNRPYDVDSAILRRMTLKIHIPLPELNQRKHILDLILKNEDVEQNFNLERLASITEGFSGSDLKEVARSAAVACLNPNTEKYYPDIYNGRARDESRRRFLGLFDFLRKREESSYPRRPPEYSAPPIRSISMMDFEQAIGEAKVAKTEIVREQLSNYFIK